MEVEGTSDKGEGLEGGLLALGATGCLTKEADPGGTMIIDPCNGFNNMSRLVILWTLLHRWLVGASLAFNCVKHCSQLLL